jgi:hypothetical protein
LGAGQALEFRAHLGDRVVVRRGARQRSLFSRAVTVIAGSRITCTTALLEVRDKRVGQPEIVKDIL